MASVRPMASVRTVDLSGIPNQDCREQLIGSLDASFRETGVVLLRMNMIQRATKDRALDAARAFFRLPAEEKLHVAAPQGAGNACLRGFVPYGSHLQRSADLAQENANAPGADAKRKRAPDRKESFTVGVHSFCDRETRCADSLDETYFAQESADGRFFAQNQWPNGDVGDELRRAWRAYFDSVMEPLVLTLYDVMAEILQIDKTTFDAAHRRHFSECRCNYYLAIEQEGANCIGSSPVPEQRRISPHKDFTDFTILAPDPSARYAHLQIAARDDESFFYVPYDDSCLTVLLGEPMQKRSNDRWYAPLHMVDVPQTREEMGEKYTLAYFRNPDYETVIAASPLCNRRLYPDISVGEHWWGMYNRSKGAFGVKFDVGHA